MKIATNRLALLWEKTRGEFRTIKEQEALDYACIFRQFTVVRLANAMEIEVALAEQLCAKIQAISWISSRDGTFRAHDNVATQARYRIKARSLSRYRQLHKNAARAFLAEEQTELVITERLYHLSHNSSLEAIAFLRQSISQLFPYFAISSGSADLVQIAQASPFKKVREWGLLFASLTSNGSEWRARHRKLLHANVSRYERSDPALALMTRRSMAVVLREEGEVEKAHGMLRELLSTPFEKLKLLSNFELGRCIATLGLCLWEMGHLSAHLGTRNSASSLGSINDEALHVIAVADAFADSSNWNGILHWVARHQDSPHWRQQFYLPNYVGIAHFYINRSNLTWKAAIVQQESKHNLWLESGGLRSSELTRMHLSMKVLYGVITEDVFHASEALEEIHRSNQFTAHRFVYFRKSLECVIRALAGNDVSSNLSDANEDCTEAAVRRLGSLEQWGVKVYQGLRDNLSSGQVVQLALECIHSGLKRNCFGGENACKNAVKWIVRCTKPNHATILLNKILEEYSARIDLRELETESRTRESFLLAHRPGELTITSLLGEAVKNTRDANMLEPILHYSAWG